MNQSRFRIPAVVSVLLLACLAAPVVTAECLKPTTDRPSIGLVLGGGGARGSAHIGVIRVLEELNIPVDCVAGTSIGSLVAALYATGMDADELEQVMLGMDWDDLFVDDTERTDQPYRRKRDDNLALFGPKLGIGKNVSLIKSGIISGQKISFAFESLVKERTQATDFDQLPIPYRAVATDIATTQEVVLSEGDLAIAMRSSMSVPGVFEPVKLDGHLLVDGGITNNLPVDVVRNMGADVLIVVDVGGGLTAAEDLNSALAIVAQMTNMLINNNVQAQIATLTDTDVLITPALGDRVGSADFAKAALGIEIGYEAADAARSELAQLSRSEAEYMAHRNRIITRTDEEPVIAFVRLNNQSRYNDSVILKRLNIKEGQPLDVDSLNYDIRQIYALGFMKEVRYEVVRENDQAGIVIHAGQDERGSNLLEWGLDYFGGPDLSQINVRAGYLNTAVDEYGSELRVLGQLGANPGLFTYLYKYLNPDLQIYLAPSLTAERRRLRVYDEDGDAVLENRVTKYGGSLALGWEIGKIGAIEAGVNRYSGDVKVDIGPPDDFDFEIGQWFVTATYDRLDDRYFPGAGSFGSLRFYSAESGLGSDEEFQQAQADLFIARTYGKHSLLVGGRYYETVDGVAPIYSQFVAGGFGRLSGFNDDEIAGQNFSMVMGGYRYRFAGSGLMPASLGFTVEYGQAAEDASDLYKDALFHGSVYLGYRSPVGPLYLGYGMGEGGRQRYFLRIGNVFGTSTIGR